MKDQLKLLEQLQEIDQKIERIKSDIDFFPREAERLEAALGEDELVATEIKDELAIHEKQKKEFDEELTINTEKLTKFKERLREIKTNTEYQASLKEIDQATKRNTEIEDELLELMEKTEEESKKLETAEADFAEKKAAMEEEKRKLLANREKMEAELETVRGERDTHLKTILPEAAAVYETVSSRLKRGPVIISVNGNACSGCHMHIPPQLVNDVMRYEKLYQCPNCHRIIKVED
ncbi:MAG: C4-type zinc ribbon domain-containing protein [Deltaproteobacteria bacterium]|nr:C4-type zinc ribbon domain-containing protein [Deltaproteobacteria bacterium]